MNYRILIQITFFSLFSMDVAFGALWPSSWFASKKSPAVGVEIELRASNQDTQTTIANSMQMYLQQFYNTKLALFDSRGSYSSQIYSESYRISYRVGLREYFFSLMPESAFVQQARMNRAIEITSPKMNRGEDQVEEFLNLLAFIESRHSLVASRTDETGLHVHVDFANPSNAEILLLFRFMNAIENAVFEVVQPLELRKSNITSVKTLAELLRAVPERVNDFKRHGRDNSGFRNYSMNFFRANTKYGSVEFRMFNSTLDPDLIRAYVQMARQIVVLVRTQPAFLARFLDEHPEDLSWQIIDRHLNLGLEKIVSLKRMPRCKYVFTN